MTEQDGIIKMIREGGVYYNISGSKPEEVFTDVVSQLVLPPGIDRNALLDGLCQREKLMTTSIGYGIAIPHPRTPLISEANNERIFVCFLDKPANFGAMDGKLVYVLFVILASGAQSHLKVLSRLSWLFQQEAFREVLKKKPNTGELISAIKQYL